MFVKIFFELRAFLFRQLLEVNNVDAERLQLSDQLLIDQCFFLLELPRSFEKSA